MQRCPKSWPLGTRNSKPQRDTLHTPGWLPAQTRASAGEDVENREPVCSERERLPAASEESAGRSSEPNTELPAPKDLSDETASAGAPHSGFLTTVKRRRRATCALPGGWVNTARSRHTCRITRPQKGEVLTGAEVCKNLENSTLCEINQAHRGRHADYVTFCTCGAHKRYRDRADCWAPGLGETGTWRGRCSPGTGVSFAVKGVCST